MILQSADFAVIVSAVAFGNLLFLAIILSVGRISALERKFGVDGAKHRTPAFLYAVILGAIALASVGAGLLVFA